jgi:ribosomal protein S7
VDAVEPCKIALDWVVSLLMLLDTQKAELVATVYAAWNNLQLDGHKPTEAEIVYEARDNWHPDKQQYKQQQFREAIDRLRSHGMVPSGTGKRVTGQESFEL